MTVTLRLINDKTEITGDGTFKTDHVDLYTATSATEQVAIQNLELRVVFIQGTGPAVWNNPLMDFEFRIGTQTFPGARISGSGPYELESKLQLSRQKDGNGEFFQLIMPSGIIKLNTRDRVFFRDKEVTVEEKKLALDPMVTINGNNMIDNNFLELRRTFIMLNTEIFGVRITHNIPNGNKMLVYAILDGIAFAIS